MDQYGQYDVDFGPPGPLKSKIQLKVILVGKKSPQFRGIFLDAKAGWDLGIKV